MHKDVIGLLGFHKSRVLVTFRVVRGQNQVRLLASSLGDEPPRRFREEPDERDLEQTWADLQQGRNTPPPRALHGECTECHASSHNSAYEYKQNLARQTPRDRRACLPMNHDALKSDPMRARSFG